ncbi:hypothetical protein P154DRAFT_574600 [Amniculicola lignicola CBS 123094]|uniref:Uncharacterized protein n=1 Tax=Amniculicola lignicola CBS 123094 TaxID=1392246 RepID=A0A6A5WJ43_9PLEO|nr:hypothetical protein P154DRAFT_574600 [Amniculicola lignicola CBS 123094]
MSTPNYSIYAIVVYWVLALVPHYYGLYLLFRTSQQKYNNHRPWTPEYTSKLRAAVGEKTWSTYEKLEAVSHNAFENAPLFVAAVVLGTVAGVGKGMSLLIPILLRWIDEADIGEKNWVDCWS